MKRLSPSSFSRAASALFAAALLALGGCASSPAWLSSPALMPALKSTLQPQAPNPLSPTAAAASAAAASIAPTASTAAREDPALAALPVGRA
jgi:hypothetical protein